ncbi:MAG TPA: PQQ-dependent sugar dehydrogenase [Actinomycetota bacterium]|nr:PQQ-dependent sugar dehydrogenase [Actinomycetota bacterium]
MPATPRLARVAVALAALALAPACRAGDPPAAAPRPPISTPAAPSPSPSQRPRQRPPAPAFDPAAVRVKLAPVADGFDMPVLVTNAGDGSGDLFVVEQAGVVHVLRGGRGEPEPFLDLSDRTEASGEQGLLGLAFHPRYARNGRLFAHYTDVDGDTVVAEYEGGDERSERVLLRVDQPYANHNGGALTFGPDGMLYVALGDGGSAGDPHDNGQSLGTLLGKILRVDVDAGARHPYAAPADNPFADRRGARPEIWAFGLRNPWRMSFDPVTGDLWIGDVGQGEWEEVDRIPAGGGGLNFGWNRMEGRDCYEAARCDRSGLELPEAQYSHELGCSVTGGHVYRGARWPELRGGYLFGDYCSGRVWVVDAARPRDPVEVASTGARISSFGADEDGELYVTDHASGRVLRVVGR